jgi:hypothetical protein
MSDKVASLAANECICWIFNVDNPALQLVVLSPPLTPEFQEVCAVTVVSMRPIA